jgi:hypothetical protein
LNLLPRRVRIHTPFVVLMTIALYGCDPGLSLHPVGLKNSGEFTWETESHGLRFLVGTLGGFTHSTFESLQITVQNRTQSVFVINDAVLETNGRIYNATFSGRGEERWRSAGPGATERIDLNWSFTEPICKVYGESAIVRVAFRVGTENQAVRFEFSR